MVSSAAKRARRKRLAHERQDRELSRPTRQMDPADLTDPEADDEIRFAPRGQSVEQMPATPRAVAITRLGEAVASPFSGRFFLMFLIV